MNKFEHMFNVMKKPWMIATYILIIILVFNFIDKPLAIYFHEMDFRTRLFVFKLLTALGKVYIYVVLAGVAIGYFRYVKKNPVYEAKCINSK